MFKKLFFLFLTLAMMLSACGTLEVSMDPTRTPVVDANVVATIVAATLAAFPSATPPVPVNWKMYSNSKYGFSIDYPGNFEIAPRENDDSFYIGEQIHVWVSDTNPLDCRGDCPLIESTDPALVANLAMTKVSGYIGSIGGNIPQRYIRYILQRDQRYYIFTLYALGFHTTLSDPSTIWPLQEKDIDVFERILESIKFTK